MGRLNMPTYRAAADIAAPIDVVWDVLTDLDGYPSWNPFTIAARSPLAVGGPVKLHVVMWGGWLKLWQREVLSAVEAPHTLDWGARVMGGMVVAARTQRLTPLPDGGTRYETEDAITGPLAWLVELLFGGSLRRGFAGVAEGLRTAAEAKGSP